MERCISLLADLALDPGCARTLFRGGAVPQMLLNAQGCTHLETVGASDGGSGGDAPPKPAFLLGQPGEAAVEVGAEGGRGGGGDSMTATATAGGAVIAVCRCRQAMRLLARLVRGLPGEAPAVVVRQNGLRSIVRIVEDAVAEAAGTPDGPAALPLGTIAATGDALEVCGSVKGYFYWLLPGLASCASSRAHRIVSLRTPRKVVT